MIASDARDIAFGRPPARGLQRPEIPSPMKTENNPRLPPVAIDEPSTPLLRAIGNNPRLVPLYREMTRLLVRESGLPARVRWLITMRMAWRCNCSYEFGRRALDAPETGDLDLVSLPLESPRLTQSDRTLFRIVDQAYENQRLDDELWSEAIGSYSKSEVVEILSVVGLYFMASLVANNSGVTHE